MIVDKNQIDLIGYSVTPVPVSELIWLNKDVHLSFYLKVHNDPLEYAAVVDIDFFTSNKKEIIEKETAKSFASIVLNGKDVLLHFKDFHINNTNVRNLFQYDNEWHRFDIKIFRDNLWCPNKRCKFEDCLHVEAKSLGDSYLSWNPKHIKNHIKVSISIDGSKEIYSNYMSGATHSIISFSNNNVNNTKDSILLNQITESSLANRPSISLKEINALYDEDEIEFVLKNYVTPTPTIDMNQ
jgi:hypothetical protein